MSRCEETRELLWPLDGPREVVESEADARLHLEDCPDCQAFFKRDAALTAALNVDFAASAPEGLRSRVSELLDGELAVAASIGPARAGLARRLSPWLAAAAALVIAAVGLVRSSSGNLDAAYVEAYLAPHAHTAVLDAPTVDQAYEFFMAELGTAVMPAVVRDGTMRRARVCEIQGQSSAVVDYEFDGHTVAHYRLPAGSLPDVGQMHSATEDGVCVVRWSDDQYDHAIVADIPEDELIQVAQQQFAALR